MAGLPVPADGCRQPGLLKAPSEMAAPQRRLRRLAAHISAGPSPSSSSGPRTPGPDNGVGPVGTSPPLFALDQEAVIVWFYETQGFVLLAVSPATSCPVLGL